MVFFKIFVSIVYTYPSVNLAQCDYIIWILCVKLYI